MMKTLPSLVLVVAALGCGKSRDKTGDGDKAPSEGEGPIATSGPAAAPAPVAAGHAAGSGNPAGTSKPATPPIARPRCTSEAVRRARREADQLAKRADYESAARRLGELDGSCDLDPGAYDVPNLDFFWVASDRSFIAYKAKDYVECLRILAPLTTPKPPLSIHQFGLENTKVGKAILHNEEQCNRAHAGRRAEFQALPCPLGEGGETAIGLPAELLPAGAQTGCLVLKASADPDAFQRALESGDHDKPNLCGDLVVRATQPGGKVPTETKLTAEDGPLYSQTDCCHLDQLSLAATAGKRRIRVQGWGRDCFGGTADDVDDAIYVWRGDALTLDENDGYASH